MSQSEAAVSEGVEQQEPQERRTLAGKRVRFEALVEIGESKSGAFEAESVDVSPSGMRLRTAYLPEVGEKLICRFDSAGGELEVEGEVQWRSEEVRGGEFGLRFVGLDESSAEALRALCAPLGGSPQPKATSTQAIASGARVRLHIDGLASPMKARVRESETAGVEVGSNLEFLKLGRPLEVEAAEGGGRRPAFVDQVKVEVDPASRVPQLVVSLRYEAALAEASAPSERASVNSEAAEASEIAHEPVEGRAPSGEARGALAEAGARAADVTAAVADRLGPVLRSAGEKGKEALEALVARVRASKAAEATEATGPTAPTRRRTTSPAPGGGLRAEGRRVRRGKDESTEALDGSESAEGGLPSAERPSASRRRSWLVGGTLAATSLLVAIGVVRSFGGGDGDASSAVAAAAPADLAGGSVQAANGPGAAAPGAPLQATVPLFGPTTLSTTEAVLPPAPGGQTASGAGAALGQPALAMEWSQGEVDNPVVLSIRMDGELQGLKGSGGPQGFTVTVPSRRPLTALEELPRLDPRISSVLMSAPTQGGSEITVQFKDDKVPGYRATARGQVLELALGRGQEALKVAEAGEPEDSKESKASKGSASSGSKVTASSKAEGKGRSAKKGSSKGNKSKKKH